LIPSLLVTGLLLAAPTATDVSFEQTTVTSAPGQAPGPGIKSRVFVSGRRLRLEGATPNGPAFILQLDLGKAWRLDPERKLVFPVDLLQLRNRSQMDASAASDLMGSIAEGDVRTVPLDTPRTIAGHACSGYRLSAGALRMDVYLATGLPVGIDAFSDLVEWSGAGQALGGILAELKKLRGFPLETRTRVTVNGEVHETVSTVTRIELQPQPKALFEPPAGWRIETGAPQAP